MKNYLLKLFSLSFLSLALFFACGDDGDPGPAGPQGEQGPAGIDGTDGANGTDGQDGTNGQDGANGQNGADGKDAPQRMFYFQEGFKGYEGAMDNFLQQEEPSKNNGNEEILDTRHEKLAGPDIFNHIIMRFDDIGTRILAELDDPNTTECIEDYYVNEAVLYLYVQNSGSTFANNTFALRVSFFDNSVPQWQETNSSWASPNGIENWDGANAPELFDVWTDIYGDYEVSIPLGASNPGRSMGWVGIPIPRQIIQYWICEPAIFNEGLMIRLLNRNPFADNEKLGFLQFASGEALAEDHRPLLYINAEPASGVADGRVTGKSWEQYLQEWNNLPQNTRLYPLKNKY